MRLPITFRELRVWWYCPEIRKPVAIGLICHVTRIIVGIPLFAVGFPIILLGTLFEWIGSKIQRTGGVVFYPTEWLQKRHHEKIEEAHSILSVRDIRARIFGDDA